MGIHAWNCPSHNKFTSLLAFVAKCFGYFDPSSFSLQYIDDEDGNINICGNDDIDDALLCAHHEARKSLKIFLISRPNTSKSQKAKDQEHICSYSVGDIIDVQRLRGDWLEGVVCCVSDTSLCV